MRLLAVKTEWFTGDVLCSDAAVSDVSLVCVEVFTVLDKQWTLQLLGADLPLWLFLYARE